MDGHGCSSIDGMLGVATKNAKTYEELYNTGSVPLSTKKSALNVRHAWMPVFITG